MFNFLVGGKTQRNLADVVTSVVKFVRDFGLLGKYPPVWTRDVPESGKWLVWIPGENPIVVDMGFVKPDNRDIINGTMFLGPVD